ncbi:MAG: PSD1 and planctomycete cytochrome C domain-containing protein [Planctomycetota bacterium]
MTSFPMNMRNDSFALIAVFLWTGVSLADPGDEFFEKRIRPILIEHCYSCHSAELKKTKGSLALDTRDALRKGGASGPAIVPGKPKESLLITAVHYTVDELKMPPKGKLPPSTIGDLEQWISMGAPDPRVQKTAGGAMDREAAQKHWAFQPLVKKPLPAVKNTDWGRSPIDRLVLSKLEANGLTPSPAADARTLIRRLSLDLLGLPPSPEEVEAFSKEFASGQRKQEAVEQLVERLLASPRYGERWGRHWLDIARYADTKDGVLMYGDDRIRPYAYTYRDYVIRAFNEDVPFDRFVHEQLAADLIVPKVDPWRLGALGFLSLGRMYDNNIHDVIDDRIDTTTRGFLGLTVACARCHDHKYDAISMSDYYALYGVFASSEAPIELPLIDKSGESSEFEKSAAPKRQELIKFRDSQYAMLRDTALQRVADYLVRVATSKSDITETSFFFLSLDPTDLRPPMVARWRRYLDNPARNQDPVFGPWPEFMNLPEENFAMAAEGVKQRWLARPDGQINPVVREALANTKLAKKGDVARMFGALLRSSSETFKKSPNPALEQVAAALISNESPAYFPKNQTWLYMSRGEKDKFGQMQTDLDKLAVKSPQAPPRAMVLNDSEELVQPRIFLRGNPAYPGELVSRQFLKALTGPASKPFKHGSGRLDLAQAIVAHPLTARVFVNRIWMHHFGEPLAATPSDFGARSPTPMHSDLLDFLAQRLIDDGWSIKKLHRQIVLSHAYQQASWDRPECRTKDPENRLLWQYPRRRLDFEAMRDSLLAVSGRLDVTPDGRPVDIVNNPLNKRRTVYGLVDRQTLPGLFRSFDFASPDQSVERRSQTTVPQQALFGMNSDFMAEQAKSLAARVDDLKAPEQKVAGLYRFVLTRVPETREIEACLRFVQQAPANAKLNGWEQLAQVLLLTNESMFVD